MGSLRLAGREVAVGALGTVCDIGGQGHPGSPADTLAHQWLLALALAFLAVHVFAPSACRPWWPGAMSAYMPALAYVAALAVYRSASALLG